jgi:PncC family amidohydrolase
MTCVPVQPIENELGRNLTAKGLTLAAAESCTGGLVAHRITNVPGSSRYFLGSVVVYSATLKERLLEVREETIRVHTVYSAEVALEMAQGARRVTSADIGVGITGIAGPDGGTPERPVGLVYIGVATERLERVEKFQFAGERSSIKEQAAEQALRLVLDCINA